MVQLFRLDQVRLAFLLGLLTKFSRLVQRFGPKMLSITCKLCSMNFSQKIILILLFRIESGHRKCRMLEHCCTKVIHYHPFLLVKNHLHILDGGILFDFCNGIMLKGWFFLLLLLIRFWINYRYLPLIRHLYWTGFMCSWN